MLTPNSWIYAPGLISPTRSEWIGTIGDACKYDGREGDSIARLLSEYAPVGEDADDDRDLTEELEALATAGLDDLELASDIFDDPNVEIVEDVKAFLTQRVETALEKIFHELPAGADLICEQVPDVLGRQGTIDGPIVGVKFGDTEFRLWVTLYDSTGCECSNVEEVYDEEQDDWIHVERDYEVWVATRWDYADGYVDFNDEPLGHDLKAQFDRITLDAIHKFLDLISE